MMEKMKRTEGGVGNCIGFSQGISGWVGEWVSEWVGEWVEERKNAKGGQSITICMRSIDPIMAQSKIALNISEDAEGKLTASLTHVLTDPAIMLLAPLARPFTSLFTMSRPAAPARWACRALSSNMHSPRLASTTWSAWAESSLDGLGGAEVASEEGLVTHAHHRLPD